jgi:hypothetical protein
MQMKFCLDQDERLTHQNQMAAAGLANFRVKSVKMSETTAFDVNVLKKRLASSAHF